MTRAQMVAPLVGSVTLVGRDGVRQFWMGQILETGASPMCPIEGAVEAEVDEEQAGLVLPA